MKNKTNPNISKIVEEITGQVKDVLKNKKAKSVGIGALLGNVLTVDEEKKMRNTIIGATIGYLLSNKEG